MFTLFFSEILAVKKHPVFNLVHTDFSCFCPSQYRNNANETFLLSATFYSSPEVIKSKSCQWNKEQATNKTVFDWLSPLSIKQISLKPILIFSNWDTNSQNPHHDKRGIFPVYYNLILSIISIYHDHSVVTQINA